MKNKVTNSVVRWNCRQRLWWPAWQITAGYRDVIQEDEYLLFVWLKYEVTSKIVWKILFSCCRQEHKHSLWEYFCDIIKRRNRIRAENGYCKHEEMRRCIQNFRRKFLTDLGRLDADWKVIIIWMTENWSMQRWTSLNCNTFQDIMTLLGQTTSV